MAAHFISKVCFDCMTKLNIWNGIKKCFIKGYGKGDCRKSKIDKELMKKK